MESPDITLTMPKACFYQLLSTIAVLLDTTFEESARYVRFTVPSQTYFQITQQVHTAIDKARGSHLQEKLRGLRDLLEHLEEPEPHWKDEGFRILPPITPR